DIGIGLYAGREDIRRLHAGRFAYGGHGRRLVRAVGAGAARIGDDREYRRLSTVQLADVGRADRVLILAAEPDVGSHAPEAAARVGPHAADTLEIVVGITESTVDGQALYRGQIGEQRYLQLAEALAHRLRAVGRQGAVEARDIPGAEEEIRSEFGEVIAVLCTQGELQRTRPEVGHGTVQGGDAAA